MRLKFRHFGENILTVLYPENLNDSAVLNCVYKKIYDDYIQTFDAVDNGVSQYPPDIKPAYKNGTDIFSMVASLNPAWNEPQKDYQAAFMEALALVGNDFRRFSSYIVRSWLPARSLLEDAVANSQNRILILNKSFPWKDHLFTYEKEKGLGEHFLYVVFPDEVNKDWRVQAVPKEPESFECRLPLPSEWRGVRDKDLDNLLIEEGCVFVHASGFIGGHKTKEGAINMAKLSISKMK